MDFSLSSSQTLLTENVRRFLKERVDPLVAHYEAEEQFPWEILSELRDFGFIGGLLPEERGGFGL